MGRRTSDRGSLDICSHLSTNLGPSCSIRKATSTSVTVDFSVLQSEPSVHHHGWMIVKQIIWKIHLQLINQPITMTSQRPITNMINQPVHTFTLITTVTHYYQHYHHHQPSPTSHLESHHLGARCGTKRSRTRSLTARFSDADWPRRLAPGSQPPRLAIKPHRQRAQAMECHAPLSQHS